MSEKKLGMLIDLSLCVGCNACAVACKQENEVPTGCFNTWIESFDVEALNPGVEAAGRHLVFLLARHSAGVASHAEGQIDQHTKFFLTHRLSLL